MTLSITHKTGPVTQSQRDCITQPTGCEVGQSGSDRATLGHAPKTSPTLKGLQPIPPRRDGAGGNGCNPFRVDESGGALPSVAPASQRWAAGWNPVGIQEPTPGLMGNRKRGLPRSKTLREARGGGMFASFWIAPVLWGL